MIKNCMTPYKLKKPYTVFRWTFNKYLLNTSYTYTCACTHYCSTFLYDIFMNGMYLYLFYT